jgi:hypothetical protein
VQSTDFLEEMLPFLLGNVPLHMRKSMFQHDGALPHFAHQAQLLKCFTTAFQTDELGMDVKSPG